jgi:type III secretory pathway component EscV
MPIHLIADPFPLTFFLLVAAVVHFQQLSIRRKRERRKERERDRKRETKKSRVR